MNYKCNIFIISSLIFYTGCISYTQKERKLLHTYQADEVLVFRSEKSGNIKRFKITRVSDEFAGFNEGHPGLKRWGEIDYIDLDNKRESPLLVIDKDYDTPSDTASIFLDFGDFGDHYFVDSGRTYEIDSMMINSKIYRDITITHTSASFENTPHQVIQIYWQENFGIVKYDLLDGDSYVRINL